MRQRVLVTGGAGFVGSELVSQLAGGGAHVVVLDNFATGRRDNLDHLPGSRVTLVEGDVRDPGPWQGWLRGVSVVFHLACLGMRHSLQEPRETHEVNATGTLAVLQAAQSARVARFVHVSSSDVYAPSVDRIDEGDPLAPTTLYGASKLAGEAYVRAFYLTNGLSAVIVRLFPTYGPRSYHEGDCSEVILKFLLRAMAGQPMTIFGNGLQTRTFTYVADAARGISLAGEAREAVGETVNLGTEREVSVRELAAAAAKAAGVGPRIVQHLARPGDARRVAMDGSLARRLLGFEPEVTLEEGLALTVDWYRQQRWI